MTTDEIYPDPPTRIVEPVVSPEATVPTPAVESACPDCTVSGNEALSKMTEIRKKSKREPEADSAAD